MRWEIKGKMTVHIIEGDNKVAVVEVPAAWTASEAQREQTRVSRNIAKYGTPLHAVVVRGGTGESAGSVEDILDEDTESADA